MEIGHIPCRWIFQEAREFVATYELPSQCQYHSTPGYEACGDKARTCFDVVCVTYQVLQESTIDRQSFVNLSQLLEFGATAGIKLASESGSCPLALTRTNLAPDLSYKEIRI